MVNAQGRTLQFLLLVRERLRPESESAYNENELRLAAACAAFKCPHPYLALASVDGPTEVWWLNAFATADERDGLADAYAGNEALMAALAPLGKRKEDFRQSLTTTSTTHRSDLSGGIGLQIAGARLFVISTAKNHAGPSGAVFESAAGEQFTIVPVPTSAVAGEIAKRWGLGASVLAVQPQWSFPDETWVHADPAFWSSNPAVRNRPK
jgi:hypothetical protein